MDQVVNVKLIQFIFKHGRLDLLVLIIFKVLFFLSADYRCTSNESPFELIYGNEFIYEIYNENKFRISPESFLQINKKVAESIYRSTLEHAQIDENTIVLDIGSGIGKMSTWIFVEVI